MQNFAGRLVFVDEELAPVVQQSHRKQTIAEKNPKTSAREMISKATSAIQNENQHNIDF